jgi:hypothetical protein
MTILALTTGETPRGFAGHWGILAGLFVIYLVWRIDLEIRKRRGEVDDPSPAEPAAPAPRETSRSRASRLTSHRETPPRETVDSQWWGAISYEPDGSARRVYKRPVAYGEESPGAEIDIITDDDDGTDDQFVTPDDFDEDLGRDLDDDDMSRESPEEYARRCIAEGVEKKAIVKALKEHYGTSRATGYRLVDRVAPDSKAS